MGRGLWTALRLIIGWFLTVIGTLNLVTEVGGRWETRYVIFHAGLVAGGVVMLAMSRLTEHIGATWLVAVGGLVISALPVSDVACCMGRAGAEHGYPFSFLAGNAGRWRFDGHRLVVDLIFWGCLALVTVLLVNRILRHRDRPVTAVRHPHAEPAAHAEAAKTGHDERTEVDTDGSVSGLP